jgi:hypothetical protein
MNVEMNQRIPVNKIVLRKETENSDFEQKTIKTPDGYRVSIKRSYNCLGGYGSYGPEQEIKFLGWWLHVYSPNGYYKQAWGGIDSLSDFGRKFQELKAEAEAKCSHRNSVHVKNLGRCYNQYQCKDCGATYNIDSSD